MVQLWEPLRKATVFIYLQFNASVCLCCVMRVGRKLAPTTRILTIALCVCVWMWEIHTRGEKTTTFTGISRRRFHFSIWLDHSMPVKVQNNRHRLMTCVWMCIINVTRCYIISKRLWDTSFQERKKFGTERKKRTYNVSHQKFPSPPLQGVHNFVKTFTNYFYKHVQERTVSATTKNRNKSPQLDESG